MDKKNTFWGENQNNLKSGETSAVNWDLDIPELNDTGSITTTLSRQVSRKDEARRISHQRIALIVS